MATEHLGVRPEVEAGQVEVGEAVAVADVEEEVRGALVVAVLEHLDEREAEERRRRTARCARRRCRCARRGARRVRCDAGRSSRGLRYCAASSARRAVSCVACVFVSLRGPYQQFSTFWARRERAARRSPVIRTASPVAELARPVRARRCRRRRTRGRARRSGPSTDVAGGEASAPQHGALLVDADGARDDPARWRSARGRRWARSAFRSRCS